jgi:ribosomal protein L4
MKLRLASRNVSRVELTTGEEVNTYQVLCSDKVLFTRSAFETLAQRLIEE